MTRTILLGATLTGLFCTAFTFGVDWVTEVIGRGMIVGLSFVSGFLGSLFSQLVMRSRGRQTRPVPGRHRG